MALTDKQLIAQLKAGEYKPVYLLTGEDNHAIDVVSDYMEENIVDASLRDFDQTVVYGGDMNMADVVATTQRYPMMSPVHLVLVKEAQEIDIKQWEVLTAYLKQPAEQSVLVLVYRHKKLDKRTAVYKAIDKAGIVFDAAKPYDNAVPKLIAEEVKAHGMSITDKAVSMMVGAIGADMSKIANELSKLYPLVPQGGVIDEALVEQQVGISKDYNVFELQNAIGRRDPVMCNRIVAYFAANPKKNPLAPMLAALYNYLLKVMIYHQLDDPSDDAAAAQALGCNRFFVKDYALAARNYKLGKLASCIGYLHEADLRSKGVHNAGTVTEAEILRELVFKIIH